MESSDETKLDDGSEALPDQSEPKTRFRDEQRAPEAPRWMSPEQRDAYYLKDLVGGGRCFAGVLA